MSPRVNIDDEALRAFCRRNHIRELAFFGSVLREDFGPESDVDVLVEFDEPLPVTEWSVYQGLYAEIDDDKTTYLLANGHWYAISRPNEGDYDRRIAQTRPPVKALFDKVMFQPVGATSPFELCDVYKRQDHQNDTRRFTRSPDPTEVTRRSARVAQM